MFYFCGTIVIRMPARLQNVIKSDQVCFDVRIRIRDGAAHTRLCCQIHHYLRRVLCEDGFYQFPVRDISLYKNK